MSKDRRRSTVQDNVEVEISKKCRTRYKTTNNAIFNLMEWDECYIVGTNQINPNTSDCIFD